MNNTYKCETDRLFTDKSVAAGASELSDAIYIGRDSLIALYSTITGADLDVDFDYLLGQTSDQVSFVKPSASPTPNIKNFTSGAADYKQFDVDEPAPYMKIRVTNNGPTAVVVTAELNRK